MASGIGLLIVVGWYAMFTIFEVQGVKFEDAALGMLVGLALITSDRGKEK